MKSQVINKAKEFIKSNARELDKTLYEYLFERGSRDRVLNELKNYQNADFGFGNALEPDMRTNNSSAIATTLAFQYFERLNIDKLPDFLNDSLNYFINTFDEERNMWRAITLAANKSAHAPWWNFDLENDKTGFDLTWGNPSAEIIGYLLKYKNNFDKVNLERILGFAKDRLLNSQDMEYHELLCYKRLNKVLVESGDKSLSKKLGELILKSVDLDSSNWDNYVPMPINFIDSENDQYYELLNDSYKENLEWLVLKQENDGGWYPSWSWYGDYDSEWEAAKIEWAGYITLNNLVKLGE
ncbi:MAG: hypothetical protein Q9M91_04055 [Candidatus Dojkabacteria bacterium]|nr:hypothetical protein [Candidatus Dojkabacteria bacterium]MDQ7020987.1 hypothetical protein [Candidatus Dojkabacteria bacterium]